MKQIKLVLKMEIDEKYDNFVKNIIGDAIEKLIPTLRTISIKGVRMEYSSKTKPIKNTDSVQTNKSICDPIRRDIENKKNEILIRGFVWVIVIKKTSDEKIYLGEESVRLKPTYVNDFMKAAIFRTEEEAISAFEYSTGFDTKKIICSEAYPLVQLCTVPVTKSEERSRDNHIVLVPNGEEVVTSEYIITNYNGGEF